MKYILVTKCFHKELRNRVFIFVRDHIMDTGKRGGTFFTMFGNKTFSVPYRPAENAVEYKNDETEYYLNSTVKFKDVTPIYDKIDRLLLKIPTVYEVETVSKIKMSGIYPTKAEFGYMNKLWNKLK